MFCEVILGVSFSNKRGLKIKRVGIADNFKAIDTRLSVENILPIRQNTALDIHCQQSPVKFIGVGC